MKYFNYERRQRKSAAICLLNVIVSFIMLLLAHKYAPADTQKEATEALLFYGNIAVGVVSVILLSLAAYFFIKNKSIRVWVSSTEFGIVDPTFGDFELIVNVQDIAEFSQTQSPGSDILNTGVLMKDGTYERLVFNNYKLDKKAFLAALVKANPNIVVPDSPYAHKIIRPQWAKRIRAKLNLKD